MKRVMTLAAVFVVALSFPAWAQRGMGGRGMAMGGRGMAVRGGVGFRPGVAGGVRFGNAGVPFGFRGFPGNRFIVGFGFGNRRFFPHGPFFFGNRFAFFGSRFGFGACGFGGFCGGPFGFGFNSWPAYGGYIWPPFSSSDYSTDYGSQQQALLAAITSQQQITANLYEQLLREVQSRQQPQAQQYQPTPSAAAPASPEEPATTVLVFRDGHRLEVRNYAIQGNTLYESGRHWTRRVSMKDIDIPATKKANAERGVEFQVPKPAKP